MATTPMSAEPLHVLHVTRLPITVTAFLMPLLRSHRARGERVSVACSDDPHAELCVNYILKNEKQINKAAKRADKVAELALKIAAAAKSLGRKQYGVIYADPPWRFEPYSRKTGMDAAADNHYPTMTTDAITGLSVAKASYKDAILFLWATAPMLPQALDVMKAWGFTYKTVLVWVKNKPGTGYWLWNQHELLLFGTRGSVPAPVQGKQPNKALAPGDVLQDRCARLGRLGSGGATLSKPLRYTRERGSLKRATAVRSKHCTTRSENRNSLTRGIRRHDSESPSTDR